MQGHSFKKGGYVAMASVGAGMNINCLIYKTNDSKIFPYVFGIILILELYVYQAVKT